MTNDELTQSMYDAAGVVNQIGSTLSSYKNYKQNRAERVNISLM